MYVCVQWHLLNVQCCCYLLFLRPPVRTVCPNHEVVVFQTWKGTTSDPGSVAIITTFILSSSRPTCFNPVLDISFYPRPNSYRPPIFNPSNPLRSLCCTYFSPPNSPGIRSTVHLEGAPTRQHPLLVCVYLPCWAAQGVPHASL